MRVLAIKTGAATAANLAAIMGAEHVVYEETTIPKGIAEAASGSWDVILHKYELARSLSELDGPDLIKRLREKARVETPIVVLGPPSRANTIECLDAGADHYQPLPYFIPELVARLAVLSRKQRLLWSRVIRVGSLAYDTNTRVFTIDGAKLILTPTERVVLEELTRRHGEVIPVAELSAAHEYNNDGNATIVMMGKIRQKMEELSDGSFVIETSLVGGYCLRET